jgi:alkyl sulfatase BDS1-like metallo-beta-lactamase superfamily hydrolase
MSDQSRLFQAGPDPFGRTWNVQFRWLQTGISIRHADTVDVKFFVTPEGGEPEEKVIALPHQALLNATSGAGHKLSDPYCLRMAAAHLRHMIETSQDMDKALVTLTPEQVMAYDQQSTGVTVRQPA